MFVMDCYGHKLSNGVLFAHHLILDVPGGSSHLGYRRRVPPGHNPTTRVKNCFQKWRVRDGEGRRYRQRNTVRKQQASDRTQRKNGQRDYL